MNTFKLKIITPRKIVAEQEVNSVTVPSVDGEITVLPHHTRLFSLLNEGIIKIKIKDKENFLSIGGGYLETDGVTTTILVSKAFHQDEIDQKVTEKAIEEAKKILSKSVDEKERKEATSLLRRSLIDMKLLKKKAPKSFSENV